MREKGNTKCSVKTTKERKGVEDKNKWTKKLFLTDCKGLETST